MGSVVSIITPCFNGENFVSRLFDSIISQTYRPIEFILVNDGSTDNTQEIAEVRKMNIEIPANHVDIIKDTEGGHNSDEAKSAVNCLKNQLRGSVFNHRDSPF
mgnify:CR=1 FL=1